jgi:hypothetical protein
LSGGISQKDLSSIPRREHIGDNMSISVVIFGLSFVLFVGYSSIPAQPIYRPFSGERGIEMLDDIVEKDQFSRGREPCGDYFLFQQIGDEKILTFKVAITKKEQRLAIMSWVTKSMKLIEIELDDKKMVPTAEYQNSGPELPRRLVIRISSRDFELAGCLQ